MPDSSSTARILIAEDVPLNRELVQIILTQKGYKVVAVDNGRDAVTAARTAPYHLILLDIEMPEMDGIDVARHIREELGITPETTPILAMSAHAAAQDVARAIEAGIDDYLIKPLQADILLKTVKDWIEGSPDPFAVPAAPPQDTVLAPEDTPLFSADILDAFIRFIGTDRTRGIVKDFSADISRLIESLHGQSMDTTTLHREMHSLASAAGNLGLSRLSASARAQMNTPSFSDDDVRRFAQIALESIDQLTNHLKNSL